jgi:hypothetical protein
MTIQLPDVSKTLEQLDGQVWGEPEWESHLVLECHRLRRLPLREFTPANLRVMIGQSIGLKFLAPLALHILADDPLLDAELYAGDLLTSLLASERAFWVGHPELRATLIRTVDSARFRLDSLDESERDLSADFLADAVSRLQ